MASVASPLQLISLGQLLQNQGIKPLPAALISAINAYNQKPLITAWLAAVNYYRQQRQAAPSSWSESTFDSLLSIGSSKIPALGNSIPTAPLGSYSYFTNAYLTNNPPTDGSSFDPYGVSNFIEQSGDAYLGNGTASKFTANFSSVYGYTKLVNSYINTAVNANQYLGPAFTNTNDLVTSDVSKVSTAFSALGTDVKRQGKLVDTKNLDLYGTPAAVIQQISKVAGLNGQSVPPLQILLNSAGLSNHDIRDLVSDNRIGSSRRLANFNGLTDNQFDKLQKRAYQALSMLTGDSLQQVLNLLDITTPNITSGDQLLNPVDMYPLSYKTLTTPTPNGPQNVYLPNGSVNSSLVPLINANLPTATGCDELGKIIPQADATANKAIQVGLQNISSIGNTTWPDFGNAVYGNEAEPWNPNQAYLPNNIVSVDPGGACPPVKYQSQQLVPPGVNISNTDYWQPYSEGNLQTIDDLPLIKNLSTPVDQATETYFETQVATGTGKYGNVTVADIIGTAIDYNDFATKLGTVSTAIQTIADAGLADYTNLLNAYIAIQTAVNEAAVVAQIVNANTAINNLSSNLTIAGTVAQLNTQWTAIAEIVNLQLKYQQEAGIDYFLLPTEEKISIYAFVNGLPLYAEDQVVGGAWYVLTRIFNNSTLGGQATIAALRESNNNRRLDAVGISTAANKIPDGAVPGGDFVPPAPDSSLLNNYTKANPNCST